MVSIPRTAEVELRSGRLVVEQLLERLLGRLLERLWHGCWNLAGSIYQTLPLTLAEVNWPSTTTSPNLHVENAAPASRSASTLASLTVIAVPPAIVAALNVGPQVEIESKVVSS